MDIDDTSSDLSRPVRAIGTCKRCRSRKVRCDRKYPRCARCEKAGVECVGVDPVTGKDIPRSYLHHLEQKVRSLEAALQAKRSQTIEHDAQTNIKHNAQAAHDRDLSSTLGASSGLSFARILMTSVRLPAKDVTAISSATKTFENTNVAPAALPSKHVAETLLSIFFSQANAQLPLLHREEFLVRYWEPVYGKLSPNVSLASDLTPLAVETSDQKDTNCYYYRMFSNMDSRPIKLDEPNPCLYFLNIVFGIATATHQQSHPAEISESYRISAARHFDIVFGSPDRLEALQGVLLLALYSVMRPAVPGVWYVLGTALRICVDLGLHQENPGHEGSAQKEKRDPLVVDMRRRLFWCTYALDRQVCVYLGRPFGIPQESIKVYFPSNLDDSVLYAQKYEMSSQDAGDSLGPSYKFVAISFFKIRQIQAEIQRVLYDCAEIPRAFSDVSEWIGFMISKLRDWWEQCPKTVEEMNCAFNLCFIELNYYQTLLLLHGQSPLNNSMKAENYEMLAIAGIHIIGIYDHMCSTKTINYTWAAVHNLFMAGNSYLYAICHSKEVRSRTNVRDIEDNCQSCLRVLSSLRDSCDAATSCVNSLKFVAAAMIKLYQDEFGIGSIETHHYSLLPTVAQISQYHSARIGANSRASQKAPLGPLLHLPANSDIEQQLSASELLSRQALEASLNKPSTSMAQDVCSWPENIDEFFEQAAQEMSDASSVKEEHSTNDWQQVYLNETSSSSSQQASASQQAQWETRNLYNLVNGVPKMHIWDQFMAPRQPLPNWNTAGLYDNQTMEQKKGS